MELVIQNNFSRFCAFLIIARDSKIKDNILACIVRITFDIFDYKGYCYNTNLIP
jgi:hypothetical protein